MNEVCTHIIDQFALGYRLDDIANGDGMPGYRVVHSWLHQRKYEEEFKEFREEYYYIIEHRVPTMGLHLIELAEDLQKREFVDDKSGEKRVHRAAIVEYNKILSAYRFVFMWVRMHNKEIKIPKNPKVPGQEAQREKSVSEKAAEFFGPKSSSPEPNEDWYYSPRDVNMCMTITLEQAEEFLGYPLPDLKDYRELENIEIPAGIATPVFDKENEELILLPVTAEKQQEPINLDEFFQQDSGVNIEEDEMNQELRAGFAIEEVIGDKLNPVFIPYARIDQFGAFNVFGIGKHDGKIYIVSKGHQGGAWIHRKTGEIRYDDP